MTVGCEFGLDISQAALTILQVAPRMQEGVTIRAERWGTDAAHRGFLDEFGNRCERMLLEPGQTRLTYEAEVVLSEPDQRVAPGARETPVEEMPDEAFAFVMPSRFCLPDELGSDAWDRFGSVEPGWGRVQAIADHVNGHLRWVAGASNPWTTAMDAHRAGQGVCRDFAHLGISYCRALNIPARYVFGYIPEITAPVPEEEIMDFAAWFEAYLDGEWYTFDPRLNGPRTGRVVVGRGRDAVDCALMTSFGTVGLTYFAVHADP